MQKAQCIIQQYGNYTIDELGVSLNGINTQGENIADNGGIKEAYQAYSKYPVPCLISIFPIWNMHRELQSSHPINNYHCISNIYPKHSNNDNMWMAKEELSYIKTVAIHIKISFASWIHVQHTFSKTQGTCSKCLKLCAHNQ